MNKVLARLFPVFWYHVGSFLLRQWDHLRGSVFVTLSDCAQDQDGEMRLALQGTFDCGRHVAQGVANDTQLAYQMLTAFQRAAFNKRPLILHGNVAVRTAHGNGPAFCVAKVGHSWVIATEGGRAWSALRMFGLVDEVYRLDFQACIDFMAGAGVLGETERLELRDTQFRSLFLSWMLRLARLGYRLPGKKVSISEVSEDLLALWSNDQKIVVGYRDGFHNTYLLATADMIGVKRSDSVTLQVAGPVRFVHRLKDVPQGTLCLVEVSAGFGSSQLLGLEAKAVPDRGGKWPDPLPGVIAGQELQVSFPACLARRTAAD